MNFSQFVLRNTLRNKHLYLAYFFSTLFSVMIFFTFNVMAFHPSLAQGLQKQAQTGLLASAIIIYGFAFFFVLYSMGVFLQSRKKEFGLLMIQGISQKQLRKMVFIENLIIGFFATIFGSLLGIGFSQIILWLSQVTLGIDFGFYFPLKALVVTIVSFCLLFVLISFFIQFRLPKTNVHDLLLAEDLGKGSFKISVVKSLAALILIGGGYAAAVMAVGAQVLVVFLPVVLAVIVGTNFLFNQSSLFLIEKMKKRKNFFWKKTNLVVLSDLAFRMKDNARSFFLVSIITTVTFAAIGTLYGFQQIILGTMGVTPYAYSASGSDKADVAAVDQALQEEKIVAEKVTVNYALYNEQQFITEDEYNQLAELFGEASIQTEGQAVQLKSTQVFDQTEPLASSELSGETYPVRKLVTSDLLSTYLPTMVVPSNAKLAGEMQQDTYWKVIEGSTEAQIKAGETLAAQERFNVQSTEYLKDMMIKGYAPILFVGIFIGIVFFVSAGSFLYFRLYSDLDNDVAKFKMIYKVGLSKKELKKMIYQQVAILFFAPTCVSLIHGAVALTAMYHIFEIGMQTAGWQVLGVFLVIQLSYYLVARMFYFKKVYQKVIA